MNGELANETVNYDKETKSCKFNSEVEVIKKGTLIERARLTHAFKERARNKSRCDCQWFIPKSTEKKIPTTKSHHLSEKFTTSR